MAEQQIWTIEHPSGETEVHNIDVPENGDKIEFTYTVYL